MFAALEARIKTIAEDISGETRAVKEQVAKMHPLLDQFHADLKQALAAADPALQSAAETLVTRLIEDAGMILGPKM